VFLPWFFSLLVVDYAGAIVTQADISQPAAVLALLAVGLSFGIFGFQRTHMFQ